MKEKISPTEREGTPKEPTTPLFCPKNWDEISDLTKLMDQAAKKASFLPRIDIKSDGTMVIDGQQVDMNASKGSGCAIGKAGGERAGGMSLEDLPPILIIKGFANADADLGGKIGSNQNQTHSAEKAVVGGRVVEFVRADGKPDTRSEAEKAADILKMIKEAKPVYPFVPADPRLSPTNPDEIGTAPGW